MEEGIRLVHELGSSTHLLRATLAAPAPRTQHEDLPEDLPFMQCLQRTCCGHASGGVESGCGRNGDQVGMGEVLSPASLLVTALAVWVAVMGTQTIATGSRQAYVGVL